MNEIFKIIEEDFFKFMDEAQGFVERQKQFNNQSKTQKQ